MARRSVAGAVALLVVGGCEGALTDPAGIAGEYALRRVDGATLPCCAQTDSSGSRVTIVEGSLTLGDAAPEEYVYTPAGIPMARSCVHEIPDGAHVDRDGWVTLTNGSRYWIPPCGDGDYTMVITWRHEYANGTAHTVSETTSGRYTWGNDPSGGGIVTLVGVAGLGRMTVSESGVDITIQMGVRVGPLSPTGPQYTFSRAPR